MGEVILRYFNLISYIVSFTFIVSLLFLKKSTLNAKLLVLVLALNCMTELSCAMLLLNKMDIDMISTISITVHALIWFFILRNCSENKGRINFMIVFFLITSILNFLFFEGIHSFNYYTFVNGSLLYILVFIFLSFDHLKAEKFGFFESSNYTLLFAPVIFFLGMSLTFCFQSYELTSSPVIGDVKLYPLINSSVNLIYYTLVNLYIYKERK